MSSTHTPKASIKSVLRVFISHLRFERFFGVVAFLFALVGTTLPLLSPILYKRFFDLLSTSGEPSITVATQLVSVLVSIALIAAVIWLAWRIHEFAVTRMQNRVMAKLTETAFTRLLPHSHDFFTNNFTGSLVRKITRLSRSFEGFYDNIIYSILPIMVGLIGIPIVLWLRHPALAIGFVVFAIVLVAFHFAVAMWKQKYNLVSVEKDSALTGAISDAIGNETTIRSFANEGFEQGRLNGYITEARDARQRSNDISSIINAVQGAFMFLTEIGLMYVAVRLWLLGTVTVGDFVLVQSYLITSMGQLWGFNRVIRSLYESVADAGEMVEIINAPYEVADPEKPIPLSVTKGAITFTDAAFSFKGVRPLIGGFTLSITGGERIALVGHSGAGKTTAVRLIMRLYDLDRGTIAIDGTSIADVTQEDLRKAISFVSQDPILFHRSLRENIAYGKFGATDEEIIEAAKKAHCHEFISKLPLGYDTMVGERGVKLSGGERQRVAIARAILKNAPILILDEATSSLDSESEHYIQDALHTLMTGKTVIVIAHRLSTIMQMDRIIVMEGGRIIDEGKHAELIKRDGVYQKLWNFQAGGFIAE